jgi:hypothetical protein
MTNPSEDKGDNFLYTLKQGQEEVITPIVTMRSII